MIESLLIANRGEIAARIARTARRLGVRTIGVASDIDMGALHAQSCDTVVHLPGTTPAETYLQGAKIIAAAVDTGAQAIHPGYGFLSEDPDFAQAVMDAGLVWVGPPPDAIRAMGLKDAAKDLMAQAGVPVVPGYQGADQSAAHLAKQAENIGFPLLIKAVAGGGGKGMRKVDRSADFPTALAAAQAEGLGAFGNGDVLLEKFITQPRHIEFQVFSDGVETVHLLERECSLQRRHQKVIEEAPAPGLSDQVRAQVGAMAVQAAQAVGYKGAGTVEFIVDGTGPLTADKFFFMEMNTRLQVEHPVTEAILGVDLVEWQLRVASGAGLPKTQDALQPQGHAMEARLYAEDPAAGFLPATGTLTAFDAPQALRFDSAVRAGDAISPYYDPMIAKVIAHGPDRERARIALRDGLGQMRVAGLTTNCNFLRALLDDPIFAAGTHDTQFIDSHLDNLVAPKDPSPDVLAMALAAAVPPLPLAPGFAIGQPLRPTVSVCHGDIVHAARIAVSDNDMGVEISGTSVVLRRTQDGWQVPNAPQITALRHGDTITVFAGDAFTFTVPDPLDRRAAVSQDRTVIAPMPGLVQAVHVKSGDTVLAGGPLVTLEAMKMQHVLKAAQDCTVEALHVTAGQQVQAQAVLLDVVPRGAEAETR